MHFFYGRVGKRYYRFSTKASRDAWVQASNEHQSVAGSDVAPRLKFRGSDPSTGETLEKGPELTAS